MHSVLCALRDVDPVQTSVQLPIINRHYLEISPLTFIQKHWALVSFPHCKFDKAELWLIYQGLAELNKTSLLLR